MWYPMGHFRYQHSVSTLVKITILTSWSVLGSEHCEQDGVCGRVGLEGRESKSSMNHEPGEKAQAGSESILVLVTVAED